MDTGLAYIAPRNAIEEQLVELWKNVLSKDKISITDSFFERGGHSLLAIRLVGLIHKTFNIKIELKELFAHPVLEHQAALIAASTPGVSFADIPVAPVQQEYVMSSSQRRLWLLAQAEEGNVAYNMPAVYVFEGHLNRDILELAFMQLIARHEILRTVFRNQQQVILRPEETGFNVTYIDLRNEQGQAELLKSAVEASFAQPFDLENGPLLTAALYQLNDHKWVFGYVMHHIISDGISVEILIKELLAHYNAGLEGSIAPLPPLKIQYKDYAVWQQGLLAGDASAADKAYWRSQFSGELPILDLHTDKPRPRIKTFNGAFVEQHISAGAAARLTALAAEQGNTLFMALMAVVNALLYRYTGQEDIIIGSPVTGRLHTDLEDQIGFYANTLALRTRFKKEDTFRALLAATKEVNLHAYEHQQFPFDEFPALLDLQRDVSRNVLFDVAMVVHNNTTAAQKELPVVNDLKVSAYDEGAYRQALFDLTFIFTEEDNGISLSLQYNTDLYTEGTAARLAAHLVQLLSVLTEAPEQPLMLSDFLQPAEKQQLQAFGGNLDFITVSGNIVDLFEEQAANKPDQPALISGDVQLSYQELNEKANQLAHYLRITYGLTSNELAGIRLERSEWLVVAILAVLKTGAAYLPIDPDYPEGRIAYMLSDSTVKVLIDAALLEAYNNEPGQDRRNPVRTINGDDLAYVIYTSGSTGNPKGVPIRHRHLYNFFSNILDRYCDAQPVVQPFIASCAFDISVFQLFTPLLSGGTSVMINKEQFRDIGSLTALLLTVNYIDTVPAVYDLLCGYILEQGMAGDFKHVKRLFIGGDLIPDSLLLRLSGIFNNAVITVTYGPTEGTIFCTALSYVPGTINASTKGTMIGKGLDGVHIRILDAQGLPCPINVPGELCISGNGISGQYLNNPELTAEKYFIYPAGQLTYKTGDLARWLPDGTIMFMGRNDTQVKVRGFRIELGEIEKQLEGHSDLRRAVVVAKKEPNGESQLIAYIEKEKKLLLTPSTSEFFVYDDLLYHSLTTNQKRNGHYIRTFNRLLKGKVVLDLGTGADAILSRFSLDAGAKKVYAIEILKETYDKAKKRIRELGLENRITLIHGDITQITLPEQVDYCVSEIVGSIGGSEGAAKLINAARKFLKDPANMLPVRSLTRMAAVHLPDELHEFEFDEVGRHYMDRIFDGAGYRFDVRMCVEHFPLENVISNYQPFEDLDYTKELKLEDTHPVRFEFTRDAIVNGFLVWLNLYVDEQEVMDTLTERYNWLPVYLPVFYDGKKVSKGDYIEGTIERTLADNGLNPDFTITGTLFCKGQEPFSFSFTSANQSRNYRSNPFYDKLFENDTLRIRDAITESGLRAYLEDTLPSYMIPSRVIEVDQLLLTANGKVDRRNLPDPDEKAVKKNANYVAPQTGIEKLLTEIYTEVLKKEQIGVKDDYFSLGGDSIKSIQIVSRLKQLGYEISIQDVLIYPQIAELALHVNALSRNISQDTVTGMAPLGPVQFSFFEQDIPQRHHFNQSVLLESNEAIDLAGLQQCIDKLILHHDTLRMVFDKTADGWIQENKGEENRSILEVITLTDETAFQEHCARLQASFKLSEGPLFKVVLFNGTKEDRVLLIAHHLVIDTVSWRILLEDLSTLYQQYLAGSLLKLPLKTDSFAYWQLKLREYANSSLLKEEYQYWTGVNAEIVSPLPVDNVGTNLLRDVATSSFSLNEQATERLLTGCYHAYRTDVNDILAGAFTAAVSEVFGVDKVLLQMEGHGREYIGPDIDVSRTVGWFTTTYPVLFDMSYVHDPVRQLIEAKESLHRVPNKGIGYGVLRYLAGMESRLAPQIAFNYLGDFGSAATTANVFRFSPKDKGPDMAADTSRSAVLDVTIMVAGGKLVVSIDYSDKQYNPSTITQLNDVFHTRLEQLIDILSGEDTTNLTPVDLTWQGLSIEQLKQLNETL
jgi:amino acid adenylation domain-containing protein/non-ribosomal peptide synthase protein (TIGR01720 family)